MSYTKPQRRVISQIRRLIQLEQTYANQLAQKNNSRLPTGNRMLRNFDHIQEARTRLADLLDGLPFKQLTYNGRIYSWIRPGQFVSVPIGVYYANNSA